GFAVLFPGQYSRKEALHRAGRDAVKLAIVASLMLFVAAFLEGFGRQLIQDNFARYVIGWGIGLLWLTWFASGRRRK
ncbi:MAG: stage II sporulation protein M, partial [Paracoccaceae bacterium]